MFLSRLFGTVFGNPHKLLSLKHNRGLLALSGDPMHYGHLDLVTRASEICRELIVLVGNNESKSAKYISTLDERTATVRKMCDRAGITNVRVIGEGGLLVDVYAREGCDQLFRGIRNREDRAFEKRLAEINIKLLPKLRGHITMLSAADEWEAVSSTMVKEITLHHAGVEAFVPIYVKQMLEERMLGQYLIAITGQIASGKTWVGDKLVEQARARGLEAHKINVDELLRDLYDDPSPGAQEVRDELAAAFGNEVLTDDRKKVLRPALAAKLFTVPDGADARDFITKETDLATRITKESVQRLFRTAMRGKRGLLVVEWAQLHEMGMGPWMNNNAIVVDCPQREKSIAERAIPASVMKVMNILQWDVCSKQAGLLAQASRDGNGTVMLHVNRRGDTSDALVAAINDINKTFDRVLGIFPTLAAQAKKSA